MTDQHKCFESALAILPPGLRQSFGGLRIDQREQAEELRLRTGARPGVSIGGKEVKVGESDVSTSDIAWLLERAADGSLHSVAEELREGFITVRGGHRLGLAGTAVSRDGRISTLRGISSVSLRIAREHRGCAEELMRRLQTTGEGFSSTLLVSPPGVGKTTFLRDMIRILSESGIRVGVADERRELAAMTGGIPQFDLGPCTDVIEGAPKARAASMLLRTMAPEVLAVDEITAQKDVEALEQAVNCGIHVLATVHGETLTDVIMRPALKELLSRGNFRYAVFLARGRENRRVFRVERLEL